MTHQADLTVTCSVVYFQTESAKHCGELNRSRKKLTIPMRSVSSIQVWITSMIKKRKAIMLFQNPMAVSVQKQRDNTLWSDLFYNPHMYLLFCGKNTGLMSSDTLTTLMVPVTGSEGCQHHVFYVSCTGTWKHCFGLFTPGTITKKITVTMTTCPSTLINDNVSLSSHEWTKV